MSMLLILFSSFSPFPLFFSLFSLQSVHHCLSQTPLSLPLYQRHLSSFFVLLFLNLSFSAYSSPFLCLSSILFNLLFYSSQCFCSKKRGSRTHLRFRNSLSHSYCKSM